MEIIKKAKKIYSIIKGDTPEKKLDIILNHLIDDIELRGDVVHIKTKKNIAIQNDGNTVMINSGMQVLLANKIELNPRIDFNDTNFDDLDNRLAQAEIKAWEEMREQSSLSQDKEDCGCKDSKIIKIPKV